MATRDDIYQAIRNADAAGDTASVQKLGAYLQTMDAGTPAPAAAPQPSLTDKIVQGAGNLAAGAVRGAGSIGATILAPVDMASDALAGKGLSLDANRQRRADMDATLRDMGADPNSILYKTGKLAGEVAGTAGAGGVVANGARAVGAAPALVDAIASGGMAGGGNALTRAAGGAISGAAQAGMVDPESAGKGAVFGAVVPGAVQLAGKGGTAIYDAAQSGAQSVAQKLMQSAIKPTLAQRQSGDAATAVQTLLDYGLSPTKAGVNKLTELINGLNDKISTAVSGSTATVSKQKVLDTLGDVRAKFANQVSPTSDLNAIQGVADDFANHPSFAAQAPQLRPALLMKDGSVMAGEPGRTHLSIMANAPGNLAGKVSDSGFVDASGKYLTRDQAEAVAQLNQGPLDAATYARSTKDAQQIPVQQAQDMKQGTYRVLSGKYGEEGSATTEAQKGLARGLKEQIAQAVPGVGAMNAEESRLLTTLSVSERRALLEANKNPVGLTMLAHNPLAAAAFMADRSSAFKALMARMINKAVPAASTAGQKLLNTASNPLLRAAAVDEATSASP